jgi:hypothetical protein
LAHAYAQCRSNKGAPGVDGRDFADIEVYGVQRWLGELALALRQETYRPDPIRRVFIPKANSLLLEARHCRWGDEFFGGNVPRLLEITEEGKRRYDGTPTLQTLLAAMIRACARLVITR